MKHLKIFESFQNVIYPDYFEWIQKLLPEEITFLMVHSAVVKNRSTGTFYKGPAPEIEVEDQTPSDIDVHSEDDISNFYVEIISPLSDDTSIFIDAECSFTGGFSKYYPATYEQPAEGGEFGLTNIGVDEIRLTNNETNTEWEFNPNQPLTTDCFTNKDLQGLIDEYCAERINAEDERRSYYDIKFPQKLKEKIDALRNPDTVKGFGLLNR